MPDQNKQPIEAETSDRLTPTGQPMHARDRRFWVVLGIWAGIAVAAFGAGVSAIASGSPHWGFGLCAVSLIGAAVATLHLLETRRMVPRRSHVSVVMALIAMITWAFIGWQTWIWLHPSSVQLVQGYTQAQLDEVVAKATDTATKSMQDKLDQANKDTEAIRQNTARQIADAVTKANAAQSDVPISVDKLPTSLRLLFKGNEIEELATKNVSWTKLITWRQQQGLLVTNSHPGLAIVIIFKKPIAFKEVHVDDHGAGLPEGEQTSNPRYAVIEFNWAFYNGLVDINFTNDRSK
jgi:hypothetical protein